MLISIPKVVVGIILRLRQAYRRLGPQRHGTWERLVVLEREEDRLGVTVAGTEAEIVLGGSSYGFGASVGKEE